MKQIVFICTFLFITSNISIACNCRILTEFGQILEDNDQIFIGQVESSNPTSEIPKFNFKVIKKWKGKLEATTTISTSLGDCAVDFKVGETYIVYAKDYNTNICRRTSILKKSLDEKLLDYYFFGKPVAKKLEASDMAVLSERFGETAMNFVVLYNYRVLSPLEVYRMHPRLLPREKLSLISIKDNEKELTGACVDKVILMGDLPKKGWSRKKVINALKKKKLCE